jgi:hypothetical protein
VSRQRAEAASCSARRAALTVSLNLLAQPQPYHALVASLNRLLDEFEALVATPGKRRDAASVKRCCNRPLSADSRIRTMPTAQGTFTVQMTPLGEPDIADGLNLGHLSLDKTFAGDLVATSHGQMLTALTPVKGSAGYVAIERVTGSLHGRSGSFVFQHSGSMDRGTQRLSITVVADSGTGGFMGISGDFKITIADGQHFYEFDYTLPQ